MSNRAGRGKRREAERKWNAIHMRGELKLLGLSVTITTMLAFVLSNVVAHSPHKYGANRAFRFATEHQYLGFDGEPPRVISIAAGLPETMAGATPYGAESGLDQ
jgi:hypothetical protein